MRGFVVAIALAWSATLSGCFVQPYEADCTASLGCEECLAQSGCGYCPGVGCIDGTSLGPDGRECADYRWTDCSFAVDPCTPHRDCNTCVLASGCEWCTTLGRCSLSGNACSGGNGATTCPVPVPCSSRTSCTDCLRDPTCEWDSPGGLYCTTCSTSGSGPYCQTRTFCS
jgi:hypothetical protein